MEHIIGTHPPDTGGMDMAVRRSAAAGMRSVQIFTAIPKFYGDKSTIREERVVRFRRALADTGMRPEHVMVHGAYVLNVATSDATIWARAAAGLAKEMERSSMLGVGMVCFHPGSAKDGREAAAERVAEAMTRALRGVAGPTRLLVENAAGAGTTFGRTAEEVGLVLENIPADVRTRAGYGLDTCHLFASGYDIAHSADVLTGVLDAFEKAAGEAPAFFHLNDSMGALGSQRDRHMLLGDGAIGEEPFAGCSRTVARAGSRWFSRRPSRSRSRRRTTARPTRGTYACWRCSRTWERSSEPLSSALTTGATRLDNAAAAERRICRSRSRAFAPAGCQTGRSSADEPSKEQPMKRWSYAPLALALLLSVGATSALAQQAGQQTQGSSRWSRPGGWPSDT